MISYETAKGEREGDRNKGRMMIVGKREKRKGGREEGRREGMREEGGEGRKEMQSSRWERIGLS